MTDGREPADDPDEAAGGDGGHPNAAADGERADPAEGPRAERVRRRLSLVEREAELREILRRTRFTAPVWAAGVVFFAWSGLATGRWIPAVTLAFFAALATGVNFALRRRRLRDLEFVRAELDALPPPGAGAGDPDVDTASPGA